MEEKKIISFTGFPYGFIKKKDNLKTLKEQSIAIGMSLITNIRVFPYSIYKFNHKKIVYYGKINNKYLLSVTRTPNALYSEFVNLEPKIAMWIYSIHNYSESGSNYNSSTKIKNEIDREINKIENKKKNL